MNGELLVVHLKEMPKLLRVPVFSRSKCNMFGQNERRRLFSRLKFLWIDLLLVPKALDRVESGGFPCGKDAKDQSDTDGCE